MGIERRGLRRTRVAAGTLAAALATAGSAIAFQALPPGAQVNDDPAAGINQAFSVSGQEPTNADVVGGALTAGKVAVPWSIFRQQEAVGAHDQVFSRSFVGSAWTTRGSGTVGGRSSATPSFSGSLNFDQGQDGEAPAIDFAGAGRTVPWATWYESTAGTGFANSNNVFVSRFDNTGDANQGKWLFAGQGRGTGGGSVPVPSLNIHTNENAQNPSVASGNAGTSTTAPDPTQPGPWITWQETSTAATHKDQIFVVRPLGPGMTNCDGVKPSGVVMGPDIPSIGGFCWQQTGIDRFGTPTLDPSLNVDPTRDGVEPDIAFAGAQDSAPWVVWDETGITGTTAPNTLQSNDMVFAAQGTSNAVADGGMQWTAVGSQLSGVLDGSGANSFGTCGASPTNEAGCSLNASAGSFADDPRVAAGTMTPGSPTVPWVAWDEGPQNGIHQVFVSRLVSTGATAHFAVVNSGAPISSGSNGGTRPDITFSGNTPYVSWRENVGNGVEMAFVGHFVTPANPTFVLDESDVPLTPTAQADVREPISSSCTANPFNQDGAACQGGAIGTPFFLFTNGTAPLGLFADGYQASSPVTGAATAVGQSTATISGSANPHGAAVRVSLQYGTTTAYGQSTATQTLGPDDTADPFTAAIAGLPLATTIHYRAVVTSDFGTQVGADRTLKTLAKPVPPPRKASPGKASVGRAKVSGRTASLGITCKGATSCAVRLRLTVVETLRGHKILAIKASHRVKTTHKVVVLGTVTKTIRAGRRLTVRIGLNRVGRKLLAARRRLTVQLQITQRTAGKTRVVSTKKLTFKAPKPKHKHG
jgi:hypothetical protein